MRFFFCVRSNVVCVTVYVDVICYNGNVLHYAARGLRLWLFVEQELIQNAEDAGARQIKFLYDQHTFGRDPKQLVHPGLARFQVSCPVNGCCC